MRAPKSNGFGFQATRLLRDRRALAGNEASSPFPRPLCSSSPPATGILCLSLSRLPTICEATVQAKRAGGVACLRRGRWRAMLSPFSALARVTQRAPSLGDGDEDGRNEVLRPEDEMG